MFVIKINKAVGESVAKPLMYYRNNLDSTLSLLEVMNEYNVKRIVFSSSATVYGDPEELPIKESARLKTTNPYGSTKLYIEGILKDVYIADNDYSIAILRYFNPVGAHESGLLGEDPQGIPNNLMPYIVKVADGELDHLNIFGNDYNTIDGTGVRDYIHVVDLALGHIKALEYIDKHTGVDYYNLGTGCGYSVLQMVNAFSDVNKVKVPYEFVARRDGDIAECYADTSYAKEKLGFVTFQIWYLVLIVLLRKIRSKKNEQKRIYFNRNACLFSSTRNNFNNRNISFKRYLGYYYDTT